MLSEINCLVAQSGGPTSVINASLAGIISKALDTIEINKIYGSIYGITGVIEERLIDLSEFFHDNQNLELLKHTPSMFLGSCRYKLPPISETTNDYDSIFKIFKKYNIKYFFYIGGNDSMDTVAKLSKHAKSINFDIKIIGVPKTIDNDLMCIDHTPGFGSAAKYIASSVLEITHDALIYPLDSVTIIEVMGRNAGWLTAAAALARNDYNDAPHLIYLPEVPFSTGKFIKDIKEEFKKRRHVIIAVSEGVKDSQGVYISAKSGEVDQFGHVKLCGTGKYLENLVASTIGCKVRSVELNVLQRCSLHISSLTDIQEAYTLGVKGVEVALQGKTGEMVTLKRTSNSPYTVSYDSTPIDEVANIEKRIPSEWILENGHDISNDLIEYMKPLILGEPNVLYKDGIPSYLYNKSIDA